MFSLQSKLLRLFLWGGGNLKLIKEFKESLYLLMEWKWSRGSQPRSRILWHSLLITHSKMLFNPLTITLKNLSKRSKKMWVSNKSQICIMSHRNKRLIVEVVLFKKVCLNRKRQMKELKRLKNKMSLFLKSKNQLIRKHKCNIVDLVKFHLEWIGRNHFHLIINKRFDYH